MKKLHKDDVERLSRGLSTRSKIGNRSIGHRLTRKEHILFEAAKRQGFLKLPLSGLRPNVMRIYKLWCEAEEHPFIVKSEPPAGAIDSSSISTLPSSGAKS